MDKQSPIGVFDSGIGGLTVARALCNLLPNEHLLYFGDTAHLPYGDKSASAIQAYAIKICNVLLARKAKLILIACNSASAAAFELVREYVGSRALVANVIDPVVSTLSQEYAGRPVGLIGTKQTVGSGVYARKFDAAATGVQLHQLATPLLASLIEEGFYNNTISQAVIAQYLAQPELDGIEALILACTHYPLIATEINAYYKGEVAVIDPSQLVAQNVVDMLQRRGLLNDKGPGTKQIFVSDYTESFAASTRLFFGEQLRLQHYPLWE